MNFVTRCALDELEIEEETAQKYEAEEVAQKVEAVRREVRASVAELDPEEFRSPCKYFDAVDQLDNYVERVTRSLCEQRGIL